MKKFFLILTAFIFAAGAEAQVKTQSGHFVDAGLVGLGYTYEHSLAEKFTVNFGAGITGTIGYESEAKFEGKKNYWFYSFHPYVSAEPRFYYNLNSRAAKGKNTFGNTGSFLGVNCNYIFKPIKKHNMEEKYSGFAVTPHWGLRRIWGEHFLFEFAAGVAFGRNYYNENNIGLSLGVRFGYRF